MNKNTGIVELEWKVDQRRARGRWGTVSEVAMIVQAGRGENLSKGAGREDRENTADGRDGSEVKSTQLRDVWGWMPGRKTRKSLTISPRSSHGYRLLRQLRNVLPREGPEPRVAQTSPGSISSLTPCSTHFLIIMS